MTNGPLLIEDDNLSRAWVRAIEALTVKGVDAITPLVVSVRLPGDGTVRDVPAVTRALDEILTAQGKPTAHTTANLVFPSIWNPAQPRDEFYRRYMRMWTRIRRQPLNRDGVYFQRLIDYGRDGAKRNQLEYVISTYKRGNHRRSALQASILDPAIDQTDQRQRGFPCLQQVSFAPDLQGGLTITGYYATQYLVDRGYGNYVGICRLGRFVAHEIGQSCTRMTCIAAVAELGTVWGKQAARAQLEPLRSHLAAGGVALEAHGQHAGAPA